MAIVLPPKMDYIGLVRHFNISWTSIEAMISSTHTPCYLEYWFGKSIGPTGPQGIDMYWRVVVPGTLASILVHIIDSDMTCRTNMAHLQASLCTSLTVT
jgi:hypothetical protein